jgi:hypothetical protein
LSRTLGRPDYRLADSSFVPATSVRNQRRSVSGRYDSSELFAVFAAHRFRFPPKPTPLHIGKPKPMISEMFLIRPVLLNERFDDLPLISIGSTRNEKYNEPHIVRHGWKDTRISNNMGHQELHILQESDLGRSSRLYQLRQSNPFTDSTYECQTEPWHSARSSDSYHRYIFSN